MDLHQLDNQFEQEWARHYRVYGVTLGGKTLRLVKSMAKGLYLQGRVDALVEKATLGKRTS